MRRLVLVLAGCGSSGSGPTTSVTALAGDQPAAGAFVLSHRADGTGVDGIMADALGHAELATEPDALVSVIYPALLQPSTDAIEIVTTPALATGELVVHGPPAPRVPQVVGALAVTAPAIAADHVTIDLGCLTLSSATLPITLDVSSACIGMDPSLDVLVVARSPDDAPLAYAAARVPFVDGAAQLDIAAWTTTWPTIPLALDGVAPGVTLDEISDGFAYATPAATGVAQLWDGLVVAGVHVHARLGVPTLGQTTTRYIDGVPAGLAFGAADFLARIEPTVLLDDRARLAIRWSAVAEGDAVALRVAWQPGPQITWDAILPPELAGVTFPELAPDLAAKVQLPTPALDVASDLRAVDGEATDGFAAVQAAGIYYDTVVPASGQIRESNASGFSQ